MSEKELAEIRRYLVRTRRICRQTAKLNSAVPVIDEAIELASDTMYFTDAANARKLDDSIDRALDNINAVIQREQQEEPVTSSWQELAENASELPDDDRHRLVAYAIVLKFMHAVVIPACTPNSMDEDDEIFDVSTSGKFEDIKVHRHWTMRSGASVVEQEAWQRPSNYRPEFINVQFGAPADKASSDDATRIKIGGISTTSRVWRAVTVDLPQGIARYIKDYSTTRTAVALAAATITYTICRYVGVDLTEHIPDYSFYTTFFTNNDFGSWNGLVEMVTSVLAQIPSAFGTGFGILQHFISDMGSVLWGGLQFAIDNPTQNLSSEAFATALFTMAEVFPHATPTLTVTTALGLIMAPQLTVTLGMAVPTVAATIDFVKERQLPVQFKTVDAVVGRYTRRIKTEFHDMLDMPSMLDRTLPVDTVSDTKKLSELWQKVVAIANSSPGSSFLAKAISTGEIIRQAPPIDATNRITDRQITAVVDASVGGVHITSNDARDTMAEILLDNSILADVAGRVRDNLPPIKSFVEDMQREFSVAQTQDTINRIASHLRQDADPQLIKFIDEAHDNVMTGRGLHTTALTQYEILASVADATSIRPVQFGVSGQFIRSHKELANINEALNTITEQIGKLGAAKLVSRTGVTVDVETLSFITEADSTAGALWLGSLRILSKISPVDVVNGFYQAQRYIEILVSILRAVLSYNHGYDLGEATNKLSEFVIYVVSNVMTVCRRVVQFTGKTVGYSDDTGLVMNEYAAMIQQQVDGPVSSFMGDFKIASSLAEQSVRRMQSIRTVLSQIAVQETQTAPSAAVSRFARVSGWLKYVRDRLGNTQDVFDTAVDAMALALNEKSRDAATIFNAALVADEISRGRPINQRDFVDLYASWYEHKSSKSGWGGIIGYASAYLPLWATQRNEDVSVMQIITGIRDPYSPTTISRWLRGEDIEIFGRKFTSPKPDEVSEVLQILSAKLVSGSTGLPLSRRADPIRRRTFTKMSTDRPELLNQMVDELNQRNDVALQSSPATLADLEAASAVIRKRKSYSVPYLLSRTRMLFDMASVADSLAKPIDEEILMTMSDYEKLIDINTPPVIQDAIERFNANPSTVELNEIIVMLRAAQSEGRVLDRMYKHATKMMTGLAYAGVFFGGVYATSGALWKNTALTLPGLAVISSLLGITGVAISEFTGRNMETVLRGQTGYRAGEKLNATVMIRARYLTLKLAILRILRPLTQLGGRMMHPLGISIFSPFLTTGLMAATYMAMNWNADAVSHVGVFQHDIAYAASLMSRLLANWLTHKLFYSLMINTGRWFERRGNQDAVFWGGWLVVKTMTFWGVYSMKMNTMLTTGVVNDMKTFVESTLATQSDPEFDKRSYDTVVNVLATASGAKKRGFDDLLFTYVNSVKSGTIQRDTIQRIIEDAADSPLANGHVQRMANSESFRTMLTHFHDVIFGRAIITEVAKMVTLQFNTYAPYITGIANLCSKQTQTPSIDNRGGFLPDVFKGTIPIHTATSQPKPTGGPADNELDDDDDLSNLNHDARLAMDDIVFYGDSNKWNRVSQLHAITSNPMKPLGEKAADLALLMCTDLQLS